MSKPRNELAEFVIGAAMLCVGLYLLTQQVTVSNSFFGGHMMYFGVRVNTGVVFIPLIVGIIMIFVKPDSFLSKLVFGISILIILASIITSTTMHLRTISLYEWIIYLVLIFGGLGLTLRVLLKKPN